MYPLVSFEISSTSLFHVALSSGSGCVSSCSSSVPLLLKYAVAFWNAARSLVRASGVGSVVGGSDGHCMMPAQKCCDKIVRNMSIKVLHQHDEVIWYSLPSAAVIQYPV